MFGLVSKKEFDRLKEDHERLVRIIEYAKDDPSFNIVRDGRIDTESHRCYADYTLYLYIDKQEYVFKFDELRNRSYVTLYYSTATLEVDKKTDTATFSVIMKGIEYYKFTFYIDYICGKYMCKISKPSSEEVISIDPDIRRLRGVSR